MRSPCRFSSAVHCRFHLRRRTKLTPTHKGTPLLRTIIVHAPAFIRARTYHLSHTVSSLAVSTLAVADPQQQTTHNRPRKCSPFP